MSGRFTHGAYQQLLRELKARGYRFRVFDELQDTGTGERVSVLRHDCDNDLTAALRMAEIERAEDVRSTYFFMLRAEMYNLLSPKSRDQARRIVALGHAVGLHFDQSVYPALSAVELRTAINDERALLARELEVPVGVVSFHQPPPNVLEQPQALDCINAYDLRALNVAYISDSNCNWRVGDPVQYIDETKPARLQVLTHPEWWTASPLAVGDKWSVMLQNNVERILGSLEQRETSYTMRHVVKIAIRPTPGSHPSRPIRVTRSARQHRPGP